MKPHPDLVKKREKKKPEEFVVVEKRKKTFAEVVKMLEERYPKSGVDENPYHNSGEPNDKTV
jgi:hypothetical protein